MEWKSFLNDLVCDSCMFFLAGVFMHSVDRFNEESVLESSNSSPLLQENTREAATSPASDQHQHC